MNRVVTALIYDHLLTGQDTRAFCVRNTTPLGAGFHWSLYASDGHSYF